MIDRCSKRGVKRAVVALFAVVTLLAASCATDVATSPTSEPAEAAPTEVAEAPTAVPAPTASPEPPPTATAEPEPEPEPEPTVEEPSDAAPAPGDVTITLLDPGAEPRTPLRLSLDPACSELVVIDQFQALAQATGDDASIELPPKTLVTTSTTMRMTNEALASGNYLVTSEVVDTAVGDDVDPLVAGAVATELDKLVGLRTSMEIDDRGVPVADSASVEGADAFGELETMLVNLGQQVSNPFPQEPVGVGARWQVAVTLELAGLVPTMTTVQTVTAIDGSQVTIASEVEQTLADDAVLDLGEITAEIEQWQTDGGGTIVLDLTSMAPVESNVVSNALQVFNIGAPVGFLKQEIELDMQMRSEREAGCS